MKRILIFIISLMLPIFMSGCWDSVEINDRALIMMVGLEKKNDQINMYLEDKLVSGNQQGGDGKGKKTNVIVGQGEDLAIIRSDYLRKNKQNVYAGAVHTLVFADSYSQEGIENFINRVQAYREYRKTVRVFTTSTDLDVLFDAKLFNTESVGLDLSNLGNHLYSDGLMEDTRLTIISEDLKVKNAGFIIPHVDVENDKIQLTGYSVFHDAIKIGLIPYEKINGVNFMLIDTAQGNYTVKYQGVDVTVITKMGKRNITPKYKDGQASFIVSLNLECEILGISKWIKIDDKGYEKISELVSEQVKDDMFNAVKQSQNEFDCDYLELYRYFRAKYGSLFYKLDWHKTYKDALFTFKVNAKTTPSNGIDYNDEAIYG